MTWFHELERMGGAATGRQLRSAGASSRAQTAAVAGGRIARLRKGRYVAAGAPPAVVAAATRGGRLSRISAARSYGLWGGRDGRTHLILTPNAGRAGPPRTDLVRHWRTTSDHPESWRFSLSDCLRSVVRCADEATAVAVLDTALSSGQVSLRGVQRIFAGEPVRSRRLAALAVPGSDSGAESLLRQQLTARGHRVEQQLSVPGVGRADARVDGVLFVEVDGFACHRDADAFARDRLRDAGFALLGAQRLRFTARRIIDDGPAVVATIESVLDVLRREEERVAQTG